ncbi:MAG TPA: NAD-dependent epimerase/dehydratase family protein [Candidatus Wujingus californicus]|uniref:NAD-dependent epimerase/dehydratase family protein n=1 Tax=Candidatus Wujingus californicus TaxID=3367618 RepID=UPI001D99680C|nr:NAD(P)-dependent oxidoreductase [Planctomycetota bacterium]MDO8132392.1 NAD(P)-dependent oxidoreductase [Candidatus Brocadiales bacterium]
MTQFSVPSPRSLKVVVFGGSGFLGSHVADALTDAGHKVSVYDLIPSPYLRDSQQMIVGDILDQKKVRDSIKDCDVVYNFAGIADIDGASRKPLDSVKFNILGNSIILEECRKAKIKRFVFASSLYVYSKAGSFYRSTKQSCELLIENYQEIFGLPYTILRYGSLYGPRADERNFIYKIVKQALTEEKIVRDGDGEEIREYIHVYDAAKGSVEILSDEFINQYVIITGNQQMKVKDLLLMIREMLDNKIKIEYKPATINYHYEITPYTFAPKIAKRILSKTYLDLGQGILKIIQGVYKELNPLPTYDGLAVRDKNNIGKSPVD